MSAGAGTELSVSPRDVSALILAAGDGVRFGQPKAFLSAGGKTILEHAVAAVGPFAGEIIVGVRAADVAQASALVGDSATVVPGGETRQQTIGILSGQATRPLVLLHEVARPLVPPDQFSRVLAAAAAYGAACPCVAVSRRDSLAVAQDDFIGEELSRDTVVRTQIPQAFRRKLLCDTLDKARRHDWQASSVVSLCRRAGHRVRVVDGDHANLKITFPEDWDAVRKCLGD